VGKDGSSDYSVSEWGRVFTSSNVVGKKVEYGKGKDIWGMRKTAAGGEEGGEGYPEWKIV